MAITALPDPPSRADPDVFRVKADAFLAALPTFATELNALAISANAEAVALAAANYVGEWDDQSGAAAVPYCVSHETRFWMLIENLADVTAKEPGVDVEWLEIAVNTLKMDGSSLTDGGYAGILDALVAGENLVFGDVVYRKSDGKMWKAQGDAVATANAEAIAIASISADATGLFLKYGYICHDAWTTVQTVGSAVYVSAATAGVPTTTIPSTSTNVVVPIGVCTGTDIMFFNPPAKGQYVVIS